MTKKGGIFSSLRSTLDQVRRSIASMTDERAGLQRERDALDAKLRACTNAPLSKAAMIELCSRMVDKKAVAYAANFKKVVGPACMKVEPSSSSVKRALVLADVDIFMRGESRFPAPEGGRASGFDTALFNWWVNPQIGETAYYFGDVLKAKLPELWESVELPHEDDGKSLVQREEEAEALREKLAKVDAKLSALDADLAELSEAAKVEPVAAPSPPPVEPDKNGLVFSSEQPAVIDYEHQTLHTVKNGQPAPAAGWIHALRWIEGKGLHALAELTERAKEQIKKGEYRYFSPVIQYSPKTGEVTRLLMGALTNNPAIHGMAAIKAE